MFKYIFVLCFIFITSILLIYTNDLSEMIVFIATSFFLAFIAIIQAIIQGISKTKFLAEMINIEKECKDSEKKRQEAIQERDNIVRGLVNPVQIKKGDKRNSVILLGLGGTGKTTLIKQLINDRRANPDERTEDYDLYHGIRSNDNSSHSYHFYISDYKGQNIGTLIRAFILQQKKPFSPMAYGHVNSLILMVDIFPPKKRDTDSALEKQAEIDKIRINDHLTQWSHVSLDAVFGLLTNNSLKYVCLFINKYDLLINRDKDVESKIHDIYENLEREMKNRVPSVKFEVILGSVESGEGLPRLINSLTLSSVIDRKAGA